MSVYTLNTPLQYPTPDLNKISASRTEISYKVRTLSTLYLSELADELKDLQKEINTADKNALDALTLVPVALENQEIKSLYTTLQKFEGDNITEEQKEARLAISKEIKLLIDEGLSDIQKRTITLENSLSNLRSATLSDNQYRIKELEKSIESDSPKRDAEVKAIELLEPQEIALNIAIKALESADAFGLLKDALLSVEKLTALNMTAPEIELIKAGIAAAGKILDVVSDALKYDQLIAARKTVQARLDLRRVNLEQYNKDIKTLQDRVDQLTELQAVQTSRTTYIQELDTLAQALNKFLSINTHDVTDNLALAVKNFIEQSNVFIPFLKSLRQNWSN